MDKVYIVSKFDLPAQYKDEVLASVAKIAEATRKEPGCVYYIFTQDQDNSATYTFLECWASQKDFNEHIQMPHFHAFVEETKGKRENVSLLKLNQVL